MPPLDIQEVITRIVSALPSHRPIENHAPVINGCEANHLIECVKAGVVGYEKLKAMEERLTEVTGARQALLLSSGTCALHLALMAVGVKPGDEVLVPTLTFVATANAVVHAGAIPHFIDGKHNINAYKLRCYLAHETEKAPNKQGRINKRTNRPITAIIGVDLLGHPADWVSLQNVADDFGLILIEDSAEALGSRLGNTYCGSFGNVAVLSFNCNKIVTTGGGGALLTNDEWVMAKAYQLGTTARVPHKWLIEHDEIAWNYRMSNICAAVGLGQLDQLDNFLERKRYLSDQYREAFDGCPGIKFVEPPEGANCWLNAVMVDDPADRDRLLDQLYHEGVRARAIFTPLHQLRMYGSNPRDNLGYAEDTARRMICLPSGAALAVKET